MRPHTTKEIHLSCQRIPPDAMIDQHVYLSSTSHLWTSGNGWCPCLARGVWYLAGSRALALRGFNMWSYQNSPKAIEIWRSMWQNWTSQFWIAWYLGTSTVYITWSLGFLLNPGAVTGGQEAGRQLTTLAAWTLLTTTWWPHQPHLEAEPLQYNHTCGFGDSLRYL